MSINTLPIIGVTMGDPAGIGPEICVKALDDKSIYEICRPLIIGDYSCIKSAASNICKCNLQINPISSVEEARFVYGSIDVYDLSNVDIGQLHLGEVSMMAGKAAFESIRKVIDLALKGKIDATVTAPINKEAINIAGYPFAGHTEIYAHFTNTQKYSMLLVHGNLRVVHVSTHVSLRQACNLVKKDRIIQVIELADYDIVVAMYHDQGHIPLKLMGFKYDQKKGSSISGINITLGLPIIRVSVDHGTAFDIAGMNVASCDSLKEAIHYAVKLAHGKNIQ